MARPKRVREDSVTGQLAQPGQRVQGGLATAQGEDDNADPGDPIQPDTVLRLQNGEELQIHGFLLRLASPVLRIALSGPKVNGQWRLELQDDPLPAWKLLYQAISPDSEDIFLKGSLYDMSCVDKLTHLRPLLGLAHKYGVERVVQQTCTFMARHLGQELLQLDIAARRIDRPLLRGGLLWLDTLLRFGLQDEYELVYDSLLSSDVMLRGDLVDAVDRLQRESPRVLLHSQLVTDLLVRFVDRDRDRRAAGAQRAAAGVGMAAGGNDDDDLHVLASDTDDDDDDDDGDSDDDMPMLTDSDSGDEEDGQAAGAGAGGNAPGGDEADDQPAGAWEMVNGEDDSDDDDSSTDDGDDSTDDDEDDDEDEEDY